MERHDRYNSFDVFIADVLEEISKRDQQNIDYWLGAAASAFGPQILSELLPKLELKKDGISTDTATTATTTASATASAAALAAVGLWGILPIIAIAATSVGAISKAFESNHVKYINKANCEKGRRISELLLTTRALYGEYSRSSITISKKKILIDSLREKLTTYNV